MKGRRMRKDTTAALAGDKLARLLAISFDADLGDEQDHLSETVRQLLEAYLAGTLTIEAATQGRLRNMRGASHGGQTASLGEMLIDPHSSLDAMAEIKRYAKHMAARSSSEAESAVATVIYFAAIANGLVAHREKITTLSYTSLQASWSELLGKPWISPKLRPLLEAACAICCTRGAR